MTAKTVTAAAAVATLAAALIADDHYAAGNVLLAARVGEGVTSRVA